jgi:hypothetical protein
MLHLPTSLLIALVLGMTPMSMVPVGTVQSPPFAGPDWQPGNTWQVKFTIKVGSTPGDASGFHQSDLDVLYTYTVLPDVTDPAYPGVDIAKIAATTTVGLPNWRWTFDKNRFVLLRITEFEKAEDLTSRNNPFGADSWLGKSDDCAHMIHDFAKFPLSVGARRIEPAPAPHIQSTTPQVIIPYSSHPSDHPFDEQVSFSGSGAGATATIVMSRTDPVTRSEHRTTIVWGTAKWWNSATMTLGDKRIVSAVLQPSASTSAPK